MQNENAKCKMQNVLKSIHLFFYKMINVEKLPKVLFIKGVFKNDCQSDDIFEKRILENSSENIIDINDVINVCNNSEESMPNKFITYEKLPNIFTNVDNWEKQTNLLCWNCTLSFTTTPVFIPKVIEPNSSKIKEDREDPSRQLSISVHGVFCSFKCANYHINTNYSVVEKIENLNKLKLLYKLFHNEKMKETSICLDKTLLTQYGGDLTPIQFRELC